MGPGKGKTIPRSGKESHDINALIREFPADTPQEFSGDFISSNHTLLFSGARKTIILNPASHAIRAVFAQRFDPYHAYSTKNGSQAVSAMWPVHWDAKDAFPYLSWNECGVGHTVKPVAAQIVSYGIHAVGRTSADEADGPMDLNPGSSTTVSRDRLRLIKRTRI